MEVLWAALVAIGVQCQNAQLPFANCLLTPLPPFGNTACPPPFLSVILGPLDAE